MSILYADVISMLIVRLCLLPSVSLTNLSLTGGGRSVTLKVVDRCTGCDLTSLGKFQRDNLSGLDSFIFSRYVPRWIRHTRKPRSRSSPWNDMVLGVTNSSKMYHQVVE